MDELQFWGGYERLESDLILITETIPLVKNHLLCPWSPKFHDLMSKIYNSYEDIFGAMITYPEYEDARKKVKRKRKDIRYYRELLEPVHSLSSKRVLVKAEGIGEIQPFLQFANVKNPVPNWWIAINKVRHEWFVGENYKRANLKNTLEAMAGLFLLNVMNKPSRIKLANLGVIKCAELVSVHKGFWKEILVSLKRGFSLWKFQAETQLFILNFPLGHELGDYFGV